MSLFLIILKALMESVCLKTRALSVVLRVQTRQPGYGLVERGRACPQLKRQRPRQLSSISHGAGTTVRAAGAVCLPHASR